MPLQPWMKLTSVADHPIEHQLVREDRRDGARERQRLAAEVESETSALAALGGDARARADVQLRQRRLSALKIALSHL
jgi:hypothetical protein